ncbi:MAG: PilZ domain-containing protein [Planctomycetota bacterium]|jgi:hypothetical protein
MMPAPAEERRAHKRQNLACPTALLDSGGEIIAKGKTVNLSEGGALVSVPIESAPDMAADVEIRFSVPRSTANTYMLEEFASLACVTRHQPLVDESRAGVAIRFNKPLELGLEV